MPLGSMKGLLKIKYFLSERESVQGHFPTLPTQ